MAKNLNRREFLKYSGRAALSGAAYGTVGGALGKGYKTARDYFTKWADLYEKTRLGKTSKKVEKKRSGIFSKLIRRTPEDQAKFREKYGIKHPKDYKQPKGDKQPKKEDRVEDESKRRLSYVCAY